MVKNFRYALLSLRDLLVSTLPLVVLAVALLWLAYWWLDPSPPQRITLATGPAQSAYAEFGERYAKALAAHGIEVVLLPSEGSSDNLQMLRDGRADLGFVQGGSAGPRSETQDTLMSLGSLFLEPVWLFYRDSAAQKISATGRLSTLGQLRPLRVNVGTPGSGTPTLVHQLLALNHVDVQALHLTQLEQTPATVAFLAGRLDALVFATAPESLMVQMLLQTPGVQLMSFPQNEAYARKQSYLTPVVLPRGVVDLARDLPAQDVRLIATTTSMLANPRVHPALRQLLSQASLTLHSDAGWFNRAHEFPQAAASEFALAPEAQRTLRNGIPGLQRYLPFSWANLMERMWLALGVIVAVLLPLSRVAPPLYEFRVRSRVFRCYGQLRQIEERWEDDHSQTTDLLAELEHLEQRVEKITVPLSYADELYALRHHIGLVRQKLLRA